VTRVSVTQVHPTHDIYHWSVIFYTDYFFTKKWAYGSAKINIVKCRQCRQTRDQMINNILAINLSWLFTMPTDRMPRTNIVRCCGLKLETQLVRRSFSWKLICHVWTAMAIVCNPHSYFRLANHSCDPWLPVSSGWPTDHGCPWPPVF